jgi:hypothetical protein
MLRLERCLGIEMENRMNSRSALTKLKAILAIDVIIVAIAAGAFLYLQNQGLITAGPKPAEFAVTDFVIDPVEAEVFEPVTIAVNLTNIGDEPGNYMGNLTINNVLEDNQTVLLEGGESTIMEFTVVKKIEGAYTAEIGGLSGSFDIVAPSPTSSNIKLEKIILPPYEGWANPFESWVNETISVSATATNIGSEAESLSLRLMIDDSLVDVKRIELAAGETTTVEFTFNSTTEGKHSVKVNNLSGSFLIVPTGYHTLIVMYSGGGSDPSPFTLNGESLNMPYSELLPVGEYTLTVPTPYATETAVFEFEYWRQGDRSTTTTINLQSRTTLIATYTLVSGYASCPSLFFWNGTNYVYVTEVSNAGWLGYMNYIDENGDIVFSGGNPWDTIKLDASQLTPKYGYYDIVLFQQWDEIFYLDAAYMLAVDHPIGTDVYSTMVNYVNQAFNGEIYTVSKNKLATPISAINEKGENVLTHISRLDGIFTPGSNGLASPSWDNITSNQLTLNLGDLADAQEIKLVVHGMIDWGSPEHYYDWIEGFRTAFERGLVPDGTQIYPAPYMEVMDKTGSWVRVPQDRQMPTPSDFVPRSFVVDLTGLFPTDSKEYKIRINNFFNVTFDYIGIDTTPQESITIQRINPEATIHPIGFGGTKSNASGSFTRYGDVTQLLLEADDMFAIGMQGDQVDLKFPTANLPPLKDDMERTFFLFVACWFKDPPGNWGYGFDFTVDPLPFQGMSGFPYPETESYPYDGEHLAYLVEYNTRAIINNSSEETS